MFIYVHFTIQIKPNDFFLQLHVLKYTRYIILDKALQAFGELRDDDELGPADWVTVKKYITCLNDLDVEVEHPHDVGDKDDLVSTMNLRDIRVWLLNGTLSLIRSVAFDGI